MSGLISSHFARRLTSTLTVAIMKGIYNALFYKVNRSNIIKGDCEVLNHTQQGRTHFHSNFQLDQQNGTFIFHFCRCLSAFICHWYLWACVLSLNGFVMPCSILNDVFLSPVSICQSIILVLTDLVDSNPLPPNCRILNLPRCFIQCSKWSSTSGLL